MNFKPLLHYSLVIFATVISLTMPASASEHACEGKKLVIFGDSLVAGYGLNPGDAYPEQLAKKLKDRGHRIEVVNAGVSGDTTSGGLARLNWSIEEGTVAVLLELGANDALRGVPVEDTRKNLDQMITILLQKDIEVLLTGMLAPPNMGKTYGDKFNSIYPELEQKHAVDLYPFFLDGVAAIRELNQSDGIHPTAEGISIITQKSLPYVERLIEKACK